MTGKKLILDCSAYDVNNVIANIEEIRKYNPQRYEMEQLTAIVYEDFKRMICAGYKDITPNEFWVRGHMPGMPLMPGVVMCEVAAQLCNYFGQRYDLVGMEMLGFGGIEDVRFRGAVRPGDRLVMVAKLLKVRRGAMVVCRYQGLVEDTLVCEGVIKGIPLSKELLAKRA